MSESVAKTVEAYERLNDVSKVANELGYTDGTVRRYLRKAGITERMSARSQRIMAEIVAEYIPGESAAAMSMRTQWSQTTINRWLCRAGIDRSNFHSTKAKSALSQLDIQEAKESAHGRKVIKFWMEVVSHA